MNAKSKMREDIGGRNLDELRSLFQNGNIEQITEAINNNWLKPQTYGDWSKNPNKETTAAHLENLKERNDRAERIVKELKLFTD